MEFILDILGFVLKTGILFFVMVVVISAIAKLVKEKGLTEDRVTFSDRSDTDERESMLYDKVTMGAEAYEKKWKLDKKDEPRKFSTNLFVLNFTADVQAEEAFFLSREIDAILLNANEDDSVLIQVESGGGTVNGYGYAASLISRLKDNGMHVIVCVDHIAASGGYMAACVADELYAAEFAYIGSVGVVAEVPNVHNLLKKHGVEVVQVTAGESKRNLTLTGEVREEDKEKLSKELAKIHEHFKSHVQKHRPEVDVSSIATGEVWLGSEAKELNLIDGVKISDEVISEIRQEGVNIIDVVYEPAKSPKAFIGNMISTSFEKSISKILNGSIINKQPY